MLFVLPKTGAHTPKVCLSLTVIVRFFELAHVVVEITTEINWIHAEDANSTERFINIKTSEKTGK